MDKTPNSNLQELMQKYPVIHWLEVVDEAHYMSVIDEIKQVSCNNGVPGKIILFLGNTGGDLISAWAFFDFVRASGLHLVTVASGVVESAAVLVFLSGKERYASRFSSFLIHDPTLHVHQDHELSIRTIDYFKKQVTATHEKYLETMAHALGMDKKKVDKISRKAKIISAEHAREMGMVHEIF